MSVQARPLSEWNEETGDVLWWRFPIDEPPYCGSPQDVGRTAEIAFRQHGEPESVRRFQVGGWPGYHTHWTPFQMPDAPAIEARRAETQSGSVEDESAVDAVEAPLPTPSLQTQGAINPPDRREEGSRGDEWQPIETFPRDHFPRLVWSRAYGQCVAFLDVTWAWWPVPATEALPSPPTHWRTLPERPASPPPSQKEQGDA